MEVTGNASCPRRTQKKSQRTAFFAFSVNDSNVVEAVIATAETTPWECPVAPAIGSQGLPRLSRKSGYAAHDEILDEPREAYERERNENGSEVRCGWTRSSTRVPRDDIHSKRAESRGLADGRERLNISSVIVVSQVT
jgi:hypothetical protein